MTTPCFPCKCRGFTLTELAISLAIMGALLGSIWAVATTVERNANIDRALEDTHLIAKNIQSFYGSSAKTLTPFSSNITSDTTHPLMKANVFPISTRGAQAAATGTARNPWNSAYLIYSDNTGYNFYILSVVPDQGICAKYVLGMRGTAGIIGVPSVSSGTPSNATPTSYMNMTPQGALNNTPCSTAPYYAAFKFHLREADYAPE